VKLITNNYRGLHTVLARGIKDNHGEIFKHNQEMRLFDSSRLIYTSTWVQGQSTLYI
jgi:hypothetical protein